MRLEPKTDRLKEEKRERRRSRSKPLFYVTIIKTLGLENIRQRDAIKNETIAISWKNGTFQAVRGRSLKENVPRTANDDSLSPSFSFGFSVVGIVVVY